MIIRPLSAVMCLALLTFASMTAAQTTSPAISDETKAARGELTADQQGEVDAFVQFLADKLAAAREMSVIEAARDTLCAAYDPQAGDAYRTYLARSIGTHFAPKVLAVKDDLILVNGALAVARIPQAEIQPALAAMAQHENAAVRFHGARGYRAVRNGIVSQGTTARDTMMDELKARTAAEKSPVVLAELLAVLSFTDADNLPAMLVRPARESARQIVVDAVSARVDAVAKGDEGMCRAMGVAADTIAALSAQADDEHRVAMLGALANLLSAARDAYGELADAEKPTALGDAEPQRAEALQRLMIGVERAIGTVTGVTRTPVAAAVNSLQATRIAQVKLAVNQWVGATDSPGILADHGLRAPTTQPAE